MLFFNDDVVFVNANYDNVTFFRDVKGLVNVDLNNVSPDDDNFYHDDPETIVHVRLVACYNRYEPCITCKNGEV